uniref:Uncharacterized protein n=2 Tax=environmental samples TaxID=151659 RepID=D6PL08_9ZZZZ|nr:hypothetical protein [uncultured organism MedDCM-OCT-S09-C25]
MTETKAWIGLTHLDIPLGKIPLCKIALFVRQDDDDEESIHSEESVVDWYIGESIFATRKLTKENDSRDIYNSNAMYDKALHVEWKRLLGITRFRKVVGLTDELDAAFEESVFSSLKKYYVDCINLYEYYSCIDGTTQNPFVMGENAFTNIMIDSGISDEGGPCDPATLTRIFGQANVEVGDKNSVENKQNDDKALMRHEWIEAVFRIALGRYEASHPDLNPGEKVGLLFDQYILKEVSVFLERIILLSNYTASILYLILY